MGQYLRMNCSQMWLPNDMWNVKFIPLLNIPNPMEELKDSIISSNHAYLNMYQKSLEWDQVVPLACAAYNLLPNEHSKESPFSLCLVETLLFAEFTFNAHS